MAGHRWALAQGSHPLPGASNILPLPPFLQGHPPSLPAPAGAPAWASCVLPWLIMASGQLGVRPCKPAPTHLARVPMRLTVLGSSEGFSVANVYSNLTGHPMQQAICAHWGSARGTAFRETGETRKAAS